MASYRTFKKGFLEGQSQLRVTSDFGMRVMNGRIERHNGIDFGVPAGTTLNAPLSGKIVAKRVQKRGAGLYVTIQHEVERGVYIYVLLMHLQSVEPYINIGYRVVEGERIGKTGGAKGDPNAGTSTGPHLHLEVRSGGNGHANAVDPKRWFLAKETLFSKKLGRVIQEGNDSFLTFGENSLTTFANQKYSSEKDITVQDQTEYKPVPKKKQISTEAKERLAPGIWQITKLLIDSSVQGKQVVDSGVATQQGSLLNFFRKVCQEPLVEFSGDTFGNKYYWIAKKPPFDKHGFKKLIEHTAIQISEDEVISENISWNNQDIYSWYQYIPYAELIDVQETMLYVPAVFFPEYAAVWGSRPLSVQSNYYNFVASGKNDDKEENDGNVDNVMKNAIRDLKYLIESNAYNPFTRKGTITINGDRRIKRGTVILHTSGEVFYVDAVSNSYDINLAGVNRTTTLTVSKGMYPAYIYGKEIGGEEMSYFNLIDFGETEEGDITGDNWKEVISSWKVNLNSFGFFMAKQQVLQEQILDKLKKDYE